ncbi:MAG TPA: VCBS repeat-containing protein, partial [Isosphaeraceae bacterium]|nr:VCBS repeat-containing protein [Isosphaeraceae bacterium]
KDQYNAGRNSAQILGAAALDTDGDGTKEIVLLDRATKSLLFLSLKDGVYRPSGSLLIGTLNFTGMEVADLDGDGRDDLLIAGTDRFAVLQTGRTGQRLKTIASYESKHHEARLADLVAGDVNGDGIPDVVFSDVGQQSLEIATYTGDPDLIQATVFKLFERKTFRNIGDVIEPRDMTIGDVDGDGRADIVLIVHDRVVILRQDAGKSAEKPAPATSKPATAARPAS